MRRLLAGLALLVLAAVPQAAAEDLTVALSTQDIRIDSDFSGDAITVFGVIERDAATVPRGAPYDLVVLVKGPDQAVVARRKEQMLFLWVNRSSETFTAAPSYYALATSRPLAEIAPPQLLQRLGIGFDNIPLHVVEPPEGVVDPDFRDAFVRLRKEAGLYSESVGAIDFIGTSNAVFRSTAWIPSNVPHGTYVVEVLLFSGGAFLAREEIEMNVTKVGFEQFMFMAANTQALLYGLACVLLALFSGWLAGVIFRRD